MIAALAPILFLMAGAGAFAVIIHSIADYWRQALAALSALFTGGTKA